MSNVVLVIKLQLYSIFEKVMRNQWGKKLVMDTCCAVADYQLVQVRF